MAGRYWTGTIDGIALLDGADAAGFELSGAAIFDAGSVTGAVSPSVNNTPLFMSVPLTLAGHEVELRFLHIPATLFRTLIEQIKTRNASGAAFACTFADGFQAIETNFKALLPNWLDRGEPDGAYIKDAIIRLISTGG